MQVKAIIVHKIRVIWLVVTSLSILASAPLRIEASEAPWYQFEMIIFERIAKGAGSSEFWPQDPGTPSRLNAVPLPIKAPRKGSGQHKPIPYTTLPKSEWRLAAHEQRLKRSRNYRPHLHLAWRQQMTSPDRAQLLYLELPQKNAPAKIEGTVKIGVKRYLHLETDLILRRPKKTGPASERQTGMMRFGPYYQPYRLRSLRRMRSGKLHYLDHPLIGVLFLATKYEPPKPPEPVEIAPPKATQTPTTQPSVN
ncbi:MAG: CsiV family protein [Pseudomonadota bacterium]